MAVPHVSSLLLFFLLLPSSLACDRCVHKSKASFFSSPSSLSAGACGYGGLAPTVYGRNLAAVASSIYREGVGCGACFQIRCVDAKLCRGAGVKVVVTDHDKSNQTGFVLSSSAFFAMARNVKARSHLMKIRTLDVEYKRVPCDYPGRNLTIRVEESSRKASGQLAVKFLYQDGQTDIVAVDVAAVGSPGWRYMARGEGAVWSTDRAPAGPVQLRLLVTGGYDGKWAWAERALPAGWQPGGLYDAGIQIHDIAIEGCFPCDLQPWINRSM
ncbi:expansin-like A1 [Wolffia australiana]